MSGTTTTAGYRGEEDTSGEGSGNREGKTEGQVKGARDRDMGLTEEGLRLLKRVYEIGKEIGARLPDPGEKVASPKERYVAVYKW